MDKGYVIWESGLQDETRKVTRIRHEGSVDSIKQKDMRRLFIKRQTCFVVYKEKNGKKQLQFNNHDRT